MAVWKPAYAGLMGRPFADLTVSTINGSNGNHQGKVVILRDNSGQGAMQTTRDQSLRIRNLLLRTLQETTFELHSSLDLDIVLRNIVERACKLLETKQGYLDILRESNQLVPVVGFGALGRSLSNSK